METMNTGKITLTEEEVSGLSWIKAQLSNHNGACVEIASTPGKIAIRDSKDPAGPILVYTSVEFGAFLDGARNGEFDSLLQLSKASPEEEQAPCPTPTRRAPAVTSRQPQMLATAQKKELPDDLPDRPHLPRRVLQHGQHACLADPARHGDASRCSYSRMQT